MKGKELKKRLWKAEEDMLLKAYVETHGEGNWSGVSKKLGLQRGAKSCRLRWKNYLRPDIKHGSMSKDEEDLIIRMHKLIGNRWSLIAGRLPGRTDNEVKNYWNSHLSKRANPPRAQPKRKASEMDDNGQQKRAKVEGGGHKHQLGSTSSQEPKPEASAAVEEDGGSWSAGELLESRDGCGVTGMDLMIYDAQIQWENAAFPSFDGFGINWELETILPPSSSLMFNTN